MMAIAGNEGIPGPPDRIVVPGCAERAYGGERCDARGHASGSRASRVNQSARQPHAMMQFGPVKQQMRVAYGEHGPCS